MRNPFAKSKRYVAKGKWASYGPVTVPPGALSVTVTSIGGIGGPPNMWVSWLEEAPKA